MLNEERIDNLEILSKSIFGGSYQEHLAKFVFLNYDPADISVFNRQWYETPTKTICLFPKLLKSKNLSKIEKEMVQISSYIYGAKPDCMFINGLPQPNLKEPEGTLHCMIKQRFVKPIN